MTRLTGRILLALARPRRNLPMKRVVALVLGVVLLAGCTSIPTMKRDDMSSFDQDHYQCYMESEAGWHRPVVNVGSLIDNGMAKKKMYTLCMKARGYKEE
jgi:hypothetical protein